MLDSSPHKSGAVPLRVVIVTLDSHLAGPAERAQAALAARIPGLHLTVQAAAEWAENPTALDEAKTTVAQAHIIIATLLFLEEHMAPTSTS